MEDFLGKSKHCLDQLERLKSVHVVLGNEACDLDSVISSLVYAYFLQLSLPHDEERAIVPVLNIPHADFRLRTEVTFALERQGFGDKLLTFRNQVDLHNLHRSGKLSLHLVDHHVLPPGDQVLEESLVEILDHRKLERDEKVGVSMTVEMVGSCATLVAEKMFSDPKIAIPLEVYHLFYETILLDTVCMAPSAGRGTPRDEAVLARLEDQLPNHSRQLTFDTVNAARGDISRLTTLEVLRKDLKVVGAGSMRVAMSSITGNIKDFLARDDVITSLKGFCLQQESHVVVVMAITMDGGREPERQLAVYSSDQPIREQVTRALRAASDPDLDPDPALLEGRSHDAARAVSLWSTPATSAEILSRLGTLVGATHTTDRNDHGDQDLTPSDLEPDTDFREEERDSKSDGVSFSGKGVGDHPKGSPVGKSHPEGASRWEIPEIRVEDTSEIVDEDQALFGQDSGILLEGSPENAATPESGTSRSGSPPSEAMDGVGGPEMTDRAGNPDTGEESGNGDGENWCPDPPQNSVVESNLEGVARQVNPPNFNIPEMVQKIREKKASLGDTDPFDDPDAFDDLDGGTRADALPFTPNNSASDSHLDRFAEEHRLPSFHNSEMVERIQNKKASLSGIQELEESGALDALGLAQIPFTPQNSFSESNLDSGSGSHELPTFHSAEMVRRIRNKRASMEEDAEDELFDPDAEGDARRYPHPPRSSVSEDSRDLYAQAANLPSFDHAEVASKIERRRSDLEQYSDAADSLASALKEPFTPPNSFVDASPLKRSSDLPPSLEQDLWGKLQGQRGDEFSGDENHVGESETCADILLAAAADADKGPDVNDNVVAARIAGNMMASVGSSPAADDPPSAQSQWIAGRDEVDAAEKFVQEVVEKAVEEVTRAPGKEDSGVAKVMTPSPDPVIQAESEASDAHDTPEASESPSAEQASFCAPTQDTVENKEENLQIQGNKASVADAVGESAAPSSDDDFPQANSDPVHPENIATGVSPDGAVLFDPIGSTDVDTLDGELEASPRDSEPAIGMATAGVVTLTTVGSTDADTLEAEEFVAPSPDPAMVTMAAQVTGDGVLMLGVDPGESHTEPQVTSDRHVTGQEEEDDDVTGADTLGLGAFIDHVNEAGGGGAGGDDSDSSLDMGEEPPLREMGGDALREVGGDALREVGDDALGEDPGLQRHADVIVRQAVSAALDICASDAANPDPRDTDPAGEAPSGYRSGDSPDTTGPSGGETQAQSVLSGREPDIVREESPVESPLAQDGQSSGLSEIQNTQPSDPVGDLKGLTPVASHEPQLQDSHEQQQCQESKDSGSVPSGATATSASLTSGSAPKAVAEVTAGSGDSDQDTPNTRRRKKEKSAAVEGLEKALDLDLSSEDEDELKTIQDQLPEGVTMATTSPRQSDPDTKKAARPSHLESAPRKKIMPNLDLLQDDNMDAAVSPDSSDLDDEEVDDITLSFQHEKTPDDLTTPDLFHNEALAGGMGWDSGSSTASATPVEPIPEYTAREEFEDERHWRTAQIGDKWYKIDMKVIEPYKKVLSHGGYYGGGFNAIVVFAACFLPDRRRRDYHYVMDNLFLYVISTLELLVVEDYMIVYFHGATPRHKMPGLRWLKRCYDMIDRRLRKNLKALLVVHPTMFLKTMVFMTKPFISSKFSSKLRYVKSLDELTRMVPTEYLFVPEEIKVYDAIRNKTAPVPTPT